MPPDTVDPNPRATLALREADAVRLDADDPLAALRAHFHIPVAPDGRPVAYLCGNSLGLMPRTARDAVLAELDSWQHQAVNAHFDSARPWYSFHDAFREPAARLVGARPHEVVMMNSLTVNLHLLMVTFFRPSGPRRAILIEDCAFPSDLYAVQSQLACHGCDPHLDLLIARPRPGEHTLRTEDVEQMIRLNGPRIALVLLGGVNYFTGQVMDMPRLADAAREQGCVFGLDLAHAAGNVPLRLHDWGVDFAAWCTYKYLNGGPGAVAGAYVHERHARNVDLPRFGGWWGNDPASRFRMHLNDRFTPVPRADGWQLSNPPILSLAPLRASFELFEQAGADALRGKSLRLVAFLRELIRPWTLVRAGAPASGRGQFEVVTPAEADSHGCQVSILIHADNPRRVQADLEIAGVIGDFRPPNMLRVAPVPLYNSFHDVWRFAEALSRLCG